MINKNCNFLELYSVMLPTSQHLCNPHTSTNVRVVSWVCHNRIWTLLTEPFPNSCHDSFVYDQVLSSQTFFSCRKRHESDEPNSELYGGWYKCRDSLQWLMCSREALHCHVEGKPVPCQVKLFEYVLQVGVIQNCQWRVNPAASMHHIFNIPESSEHDISRR